MKFLLKWLKIIKQHYGNEMVGLEITQSDLVESESPAKHGEFRDTIIKVSFCIIQKHWE